MLNNICKRKEMKDKSLSALYKERENLCKKLAKFKEIIRGSVVILRKPCTYPSCKKCKSGEKHPLPYLSQSKNGKTNLIYLPKHLREKAKKWVENYKGAKNIIERLSEVNFEILKKQRK